MLDEGWDKSGVGNPTHSPLVQLCRRGEDGHELIDLAIQRVHDRVSELRDYMLLAAMKDGSAATMEVYSYVLFGVAYYPRFQ